MNYDRVALADVSKQCFELRALGVLAAALISKYFVWRFRVDAFNLPFWVLIDGGNATVSVSPGISQLGTLAAISHAESQKRGERQKRLLLDAQSSHN